jgi:hypothetical protein
MMVLPPCRSTRTSRTRDFAPAAGRRLACFVSDRRGGQSATMGGRFSDRARLSNCQASCSPSVLASTSRTSLFPTS